MRVGLDVRYISHGLTGGVRTYVYHLAKELPRCAPRHEFFFYADDKQPFELTDLPRNVSLRILPWGGTLGSIRNDRSIGRWMDQDQVDVAHFPGNYGPASSAPLVVTVHDALNLFPMSQHLRGFSRRPRQVGMMLYLGHMTRSTLKRAAHVLTVSEHARRDIAARSGYPFERITATHQAGAAHFAPIDDCDTLRATQARYNLGSRFVLADGIKNPAALIDAFDRLPAAVRAATQLVFFSREPVPRPPVAAVLARSDVRFIPQPTSDELVKLMNLATVFAFPSWYEGFGLPLVEAMQCGTPIIASSRASIPEVVGDAGLIFDLEEPEQAADCLRKILVDEALRLSIAGRARARASEFTWERTARRTLEVYEDVVRAATHPA
jgi:glycosyltransferase involved in cell wall biosynthesis